MTKEIRMAKAQKNLPPFCHSQQFSDFELRDSVVSRSRRAGSFVIFAVLLLAPASNGLAGDFATLCADRAAIERVYYEHRLGTKPPFEETLPRATLERLVRLDLRKEEVLRKHYGIAVTPAMLSAEIQRINATTRAPEMLVEIKTALGSDPEKFATVFAKPIVVERLLRDKFDNDDALHAGVRRECEQVRNDLLTAKTNGADAARLLAKMKLARSNTLSETTWQMTTRPTATNGPTTEEMEIKRRFGPNAQILSGGHEGDDKLYFAELPPELQNVLRAQLRKPGDLSAVIETPTGFLLYLTRERTERALSVAVLSLPKRSYEEWLQE
jgi:hypothetical protein